jgi:plasmid stabilization system protein ParE
MKLRYERGALADLDEIFTYIAGENREAAMRLAASLRGGGKANCGEPVPRRGDAQVEIPAISNWQLFDCI